MISRPAIEPAISTLPVMNQLIAKVSSVPIVRQLMALRTDLACVSAPRNKTTRVPPHVTTTEPITPGTLRVSAACLAHHAEIAELLMDPVRVLLHFAQRNPENSLIELTNRDSSATACVSGQFHWPKKGLK